VPLWYRESQLWEQERVLLDTGRPPRPGIEEYSLWRETTDRCVLEALEMYSTFLSGQSSGMSDALSLPAVESLFKILRYPSAARPAMTWVLLRIHSGLMEIRRREAAMKVKRG
jgi:hypothetical protein